MDFHVHEHVKTDGRRLWLYSRGPRDYTVTHDLPPVAAPSEPIRRWHPLRDEPVYYNPGRNTRSLNPPPEYNPLAPVAEGGFPGEIPVTDFEVAIFQNRWPGLSDAFGTDPGRAYGRCEVVVYHPEATGSLGDLGADRVALLLQAIGDRARRIMADPEIRLVLPFENRGAFVGATLPHPHGQLYALADAPPVIARQMGNAAAFPDVVAAGHVVAENDAARAICPDCARYPYEVWLTPKAPVASPADLGRALPGFAALLGRLVRGLDRMFSAPAPFVLWHALPMRGVADWPYHIQIWPMQRGEGKMKYLASVEQITGLYLVDVPPEDAAVTWRQVLERVD